jgi:tripartite-type tricarboxylate transporter receptor subunit TctC
MIDPMITALPLVQGGQLKALAVASSKRTSVLPDVPTAAESGLPGLEFSSWYGLWGPKDLPKEIVTRVNAVILESMREPAVIEKLVSLGFEPVASGTPDEFAALITSDIARNAALLSAAKFEPQ